MSHDWISSLASEMPEFGPAGRRIRTPRLRRGSFVIAAGPGQAIAEGLSTSAGLVRVDVDLGATRITRPRSWGTESPRVIQFRSRLEYSPSDVARVNREVGDLRPDVVIVGDAASSELDDFRWAVVLAEDLDAPTILAVDSDDAASGGVLAALGLPDPADASSVRLFVADPKLAFREGVPRVDQFVARPLRAGRTGSAGSAGSSGTERLIRDSFETVRGLDFKRLRGDALAGGEQPAQPRHVNTVVYRAADRIAVRPRENLALGTDYRLGVGIGQHREDSLLPGDATFPDEVLGPAARRLGLFVLAGQDPAQAQRGYLYLPEQGPAFTCPVLDQAASDFSSDAAGWSSQDHESCPGPHGELAEFTIPQRISPGLIELEVLIYAGAAAVHMQKIELSVLRGPGAAANVTYRLLYDFDKLPDLTDRVASLVEGDDHLTVNAVAGPGTFSFRFTETNYSPAAVAVRKALTSIHFVKGNDDQYRPRYPDVAAPPAAYEKTLLELAKTGRRLFNDIFNTVASRALAPMLENEAKVRGRPPVVQIARTALRPFVVPWQVLYDLPMEDPEHGLRTCPSVREYGPGGPGRWPPPAACPHQDYHEQAKAEAAKPALLCPWGFWGLAHLIEVPEPPPEKRSLDQVISELPAAAAVLPGTGSGLNDKQLREHLTKLRTKVTGFPADAVTAALKLLPALGETTMDIVYLIGHAEQATAGLSYVLAFPDRTLASEDVATWTRDYWPVNHWHNRRPLVVLNACQTAEITQSTMGNFVKNFVAAGAAGVIGTETLIDQAAASEAMEHFLAEFSARSTAGEAIRLMRWRLLGRGNLLGFSYTPYCAASLRLRPASMYPEDS